MVCQVMLRKFVVTYRLEKNIKRFKYQWYSRLINYHEYWFVIEDFKQIILIKILYNFKESDRGYFFKGERSED